MIELFENCYIKKMKKIILSLICITTINFLSYAQQIQSPLVKSFEEYKKLKEKSIFNLDWVSLGPVVNSARVESIQVDEKKSWHNVCCFWFREFMENYK